MASRHRRRGRQPAAGSHGVAVCAAPPPRDDRQRLRDLPGAVQAPLPQVGPLLGDDLCAGNAPLCWDPFEVYDPDLVTNPNVFVMGEPGFAKSSLIKCWAAWQTCLYGEQRWLTFTDPKGEYRPLAELIGMTVMRVAPGAGVRINPLEAPRRLGR